MARLPIELESHERRAFLAAVAIWAHMIVDHAEPALLNQVVRIGQPEYPASADDPLVVVLPRLRVPLQLQIARAHGNVVPFGDVVSGKGLGAGVLGGGR